MSSTDPKSPPEGGLLHVQEAAHYLALSVRTLRSLAKRREIAVVRCGRSVRFARADLERFIASRREGGAA